MNSGYNGYMNVSRGTRREKHPVAGEPEGPDPKGTLAAALALCRRDKISLTPGRRRILEILASEGRPLGAYEMIDRVAESTGKRPAPISIYRELKTAVAMAEPALLFFIAAFIGTIFINSPFGSII